MQGNFGEAKMMDPTLDARVSLDADALVRDRVPASGETPLRKAASRPLPENTMIILPVRDAVLFPGMLLPLGLEREQGRVAAREALRLERPVGVLLQNNPDSEDPTPGD